MSEEIKTLDVWRDNKHGKLYRVYRSVEHLVTGEIMIILTDLSTMKNVVVSNTYLLGNFTKQRSSGYGRK